MSAREDICVWERKWSAFNAFIPQCQAYLGMYGDPPTGVPTAGQRYCAWCGKPMKLTEAAHPTTPTKE